MRVRNASLNPVLGRALLGPGDEGEVDVARPGVRSMIDAGLLVALDDVPAAPSAAAELDAARAEIVALKATVAEHEATIGALRATVDGLTAADRPAAEKPKKGG
jgi:hypothetical protein